MSALRPVLGRPLSWQRACPGPHERHTLSVPRRPFANDLSQTTFRSTLACLAAVFYLQQLSDHLARECCLPLHTDNTVLPLTTLHNTTQHQLRRVTHLESHYRQTLKIDRCRVCVGVERGASRSPWPRTMACPYGCIPLLAAWRAARSLPKRAPQTLGLSRLSASGALRLPLTQAPRINDFLISETD